MPFSRYRIKKHAFNLLQHLSQALNLSFPLAFFIELLSCLQILAVTILPIVLENNIPGQDDLSKTLNNLLLYLRPFEIFNPFTSDYALVVIMPIYGAYLIGLLTIFALMFYQLSQGKSINSWSKIPSFCILLHSKILFYPIHCFLISTLDHTTENSNTNLSKNKAPWIVISVFLLIFNLAIAITKELFCFQIHQNQDTYAIKDNLFGLNVLTHKAITIMLFYFLQDSKYTAVILTNIVFSSISLTILHVRLPFYNLKMLKLSLVISTITTWTSILSVIRIFDSQNKILLLLIFLTSGFAVKISLIKFTRTLKDIRNLQNLTPHHIAHLPVLIKQYEMKSCLTPLQDKTNKETLYSLGFSNGENYHNQAYTIITKEMLNMYRQTRHNKDARELLSLCAAHIYIHIFGDALKAMVILGKLNANNNMSIVARLSYKTLSLDLEALNYEYATALKNEGNSSSSHLDYFIYKLKTETLKEYIKQEIEQHQTFWKLLSSPTVEVMPVISQGTLISKSTSKVSRYWNTHFEDSELTYVNASIMYGLYLKTLQSLPSGGAALVRKAFNSLNNKQHPHRDVIDIVLGNRAVIVASIEPDKIGKIVDTSSSVNKIFKMHKNKLIGTNIGMLMPSLIAAQHNELIRKYHRNSKQSLNRVIKTYAKTMTDKYFSAELILRLSPFMHNGLTVVASIEKTSEYNSVIILDYEGNIVEYSKDLADSLNLTAKKSQQRLKIETFSKELREVNAAFNFLYCPSQKSAEENSAADLDLSQDEVPIEDYFKSNSIVYPRKSHNKKETIIASPRTSRPLLLSSMENDIAPSSDRRNLFIETTERHNSIHLQTVQPSFTKEEAERICDIYKYGKDILFLPLNQKLTLNSKPAEIKCKTEIEPLVFQNKLYKILKIKETSSPSLPKTSLSQVPSTTISPLLQKELSVPAEFTDTLPIEGPGSERAKQHKCSIEPSLDAKNFRNELPRLSQISSHLPPTNFALTKEQIPLSESFTSQMSKKKTFKANSLVTSQFSQQATAKQLNSSLKIEKQSPEIRLAVHMVYLAIVIILCSMFVDLIYTDKSLENMSDSIGLVGLVSGRLGKTILALQNLLSLYARSIGFRKIDAKLPFNKALALNATIDMLTNGQELLQKVDEVSDKEVSRIFYEKSISFWEPQTHTLFNEKKLDSFVANNIIVDYNLFFIRYNGSLFDLKNSRKGLFAINNTANDYILSVDRTISEISIFFENTKNRSISLLKIIVTLETLFIIIPFVLTIYILVTTIKLYKKLFQALCKIHIKSHTWRISQLANIAALFEETIEDDISYFNELKAKTNNGGKAEIGKKIQSHISKEYQEKGLVIYGLKYLLLTFLLTGLIIGLIINSFRTSMSSFKDLNSIKRQISGSFDMNSRVKIAFPSFYVAGMFYNDTSYMMRNQNPAEVLIAGVEYLGGANAHILEALSDSNNEITDPVINRVLQGKVCDLVPSVYYANCIQNTDGEAFGLLGMQPKVYNIMMILKNWALSANPTWDAAQVALNQVSAIMNNLHFIIFELYDFLAEHLIASFVKKAEEQKSLAVRVFWVNVVVTLVTMFLIRVIVLRKMQELDIGIRRILRIIPYKIIEENKVMGFYLVKAFGKEVEILKQLI